MYISTFVGINKGKILIPWTILSLAAKIDAYSSPCACVVLLIQGG